jgi:hypothetical protein
MLKNDDGELNNELPIKQLKLDTDLTANLKIAFIPAR